MAMVRTRGLLKGLGRRPAVQGALVVHARPATSARSARPPAGRPRNGEAVAADAWAGRAPVIVAFWHNRLMLMPYCWPSTAPFHMLISSHPDGRLIARTVAYFGIDAIAGSSRKGGSEALRTLMRKLQRGESVGITPDGPRGPRMHAGDGAIALARLSGVPILPAAAAVSRRVVLNTWDRLIVALPFSPWRHHLGRKPIVRAPRCPPEDVARVYRQRLEDELIRVTAEADRSVGTTPIAPATAAEHARYRNRHAAA